MDRAERQKLILLCTPHPRRRLLCVVRCRRFRRREGTPRRGGEARSGAGRPAAGGQERPADGSQSGPHQARAGNARGATARVSRRLPTEHESAEVLRSVEKLAGKSGLTVGQVRRRPNRPQELYVEIPMEVGVGGGYQELLKFADQLAQLPRLVTLNEVKVRARAPGRRPPPPVGAAPICRRGACAPISWRWSSRRSPCLCGGAPGPAAAQQPAKR